MNLDNIELIEPLEDGTTDSSPPEGVDPVLWKIWQDEEELKKDKYLWQLKRGMEGHNVGLDNGLTNINKYIYGTHKGRYYLIGAESGVGKTTIGDFMYVLKAWESAKKMGRKIKIFYFSFEIGKTEKLYRWTSYYIFTKFGLQLPSDYLQGRISGMLPSQKDHHMIMAAYTVIKEMLNDVTIVEDVLHPTKIFEAMVEEHFAKHGTVIRDTVSEEEKKKHPNKKGYVKGYTESDPDMITLMIVDHLALAGNEMGLDTKGIMDKLSKYAIVLRNLFHCTVLFIQQFSTDMMAAYRGAFGKKNEASLAPQRLDFGDSKATFRDADVVMGGTKPQREMSMFMGYNIGHPDSDGLGEYFVAWYVMKNRYGPANRMIPMFLDPIVGIPYDLPLEPNNPMAMQEWIDRAIKLEQICKTYSPKVKSQ